MSEDKIREAIEAQITKLRLDGKEITDLTTLAGYTKLEALHLKDNKVTELAPLVGMTELGRLNLRENQITDLSPLAGLTKLVELNLSYNQITDLAPLAGLTKLKELFLGNNRIADLTSLAGLTNLKALLSPLFPRYAAEGKSYLTIAVGCTGGRHRSVCVTEDLSAWVAQQGEQVHVRHRDLENRSK